MSALAILATGWAVAAYLAGGPFGIVASMAFYKRFNSYKFNSYLRPRSGR